MRTLFAVARIKQPSIIFIDEIDSLLTQRSDQEHESSRRMKTEFLVQFDGLTTDKNERLLVIGATNRPQELDEAVRRRFTKRLYIPLPCRRARQELTMHHMRQNPHNLTDAQFEKLCDTTKGYSGADMFNLCQEAVMGMVRRVGVEHLKSLTKHSELPPVTMEDFLNAVKTVKATVSGKELGSYAQWNQSYGAIPNMEEDDEHVKANDDGENSEMDHDDIKSLVPSSLSNSPPKVTDAHMDSQPTVNDIVVKTERIKDGDISVYIID